MEQQLSLQPLAHIQEDLTTLPHLRFYLQEDICLLDSKSSPMQLPFNQLAAQVITEICTTNKLLALNTKANNNLIENGRQIFEKKKQYIDSFLAHYELIKRTLVYLSPELREIFQFTMIALSNLILKLSINMSKISIIIINKLILPSYLNILMASLAFENFIQCKFLKNKEGHLEDRANYIKQFPKITVIKLSAIQNSYDSFLINQSQNLFDKEAAQIQFIDLFCQKDIKIIDHSEESNTKRIQSYDLGQVFGLTPPFGNQLFLFFMEVLLQKMLEFKPDVVIYFQDCPSEKVLIQPAVKGLLMNQISTKVQNKIIIFKEIGCRNLAEVKHFYEGFPIEPEVQSMMKLQESLYSNNFNSAESNEVLQKHVSQLVKIQIQLNKDLSKYRRQFFIGKRQAFDHKKVFVESNPRIGSIINRLKRHLNEEMSNLSMSLIQKSNFEEVEREFHNYVFPVQFLIKFIQWLKSEGEKIENGQYFSQISYMYKSKVDKLNGMKEMTLQRLNQSNNPQNIETVPFYNFVEKRRDFLIYNQNGQECPILTHKQDPFLIHYEEEYMLFFHINKKRFTMYRKEYSKRAFQFIKEDHLSLNPSLAANYSILMANKEYFYKAFGEFSGTDSGRSLICRLNIKNVKNMKNQPWEVIESCFMLADNKKVRVPLEPKKYGWAQSVNLGKENLTIIGGGYNCVSQNEEKVSKYLYIIPNHTSQIYKIGKVNSLFFNQLQNIKAENSVHPFVYGMPVSISSSELVILNTNGFYENLNHFKRFYLTKYKIPQKAESLQMVTAFSQNKMEYMGGPEDSIADKNTILRYILRGYHQINRYKGQNCLYNVEGEPVVLKFSGNYQEGHDKVAVETLKEGELDLETIEISASFPRRYMIPRKKAN